jgi:AraC-like DNA-binding protein
MRPAATKFKWGRAMLHPPPVFRFSTDDVAPRDRVAVWHELIFQSAAKVEMALEPGVPFRASAALRQLPGLRILEGVSPPATYRRATGGMETDEVAFQFGHSENLAARVSRRETAIESGEAFLLPCGDRATVTVPRPSQFVLLRLPRAAVAERVRDLGAIYCRPIAAGTPALSLAKRYLGLLGEASDALVAPELQHAAVTHLYDLLAIILGATKDAAHIAERRGLRAARLEVMKNDIARSLHDPNLSIRALASRHGVTPRYVQRLFEQTGGTFTEHVIAQRLVRANRLLSDPRLSERSVTSIAFAVGFGDLSYFNRAFRKRFGVTPSDVRAIARSGDQA